MSSISNEQTSVFLYSLLFGAVLFLLYEVFRIIRMCCKSNRIICIAADVLFMVIAAVVTFIIALSFNKGKVRFFICEGEAIGFFALLFTLGRLAKKLYQKIQSPIKRICSYISKIFKKLPVNHLQMRSDILYNVEEKEGILHKLLKKGKTC